MMHTKDLVEGSFVDSIPFIHLMIRNPKANKTTVVELLIDTGTEHTLIPRRILFDTLKLKQSDIVREISIVGIVPTEECTVYSPLFLVDIFISHQWLKQIGVVAFNFTTDHGILGRNILRYFNLELNFLHKTINFKNK